MTVPTKRGTTEVRPGVARDIRASYARQYRTEPCVCGLSITATDGDWQGIAAKLRLHYLGSTHQAYRARYAL